MIEPLLLLVLMAPTLGAGSGPPSLVDPCTSVAADAAATIGRDDGGHLLESRGIGYDAMTRKCRRFVADFALLANASSAHPLGASDRLWLSGAVGFAAMPKDEPTCAQLEVKLAVYKKVAGQQTFVRVSAASYRGAWNAGMGLCLAARSSGAGPPRVSPNPAGTDTYRVTVAAKVGSLAKPVYASMSFAPAK
jgi:hypothetical protein